MLKRRQVGTVEEALLLLYSTVNQVFASFKLFTATTGVKWGLGVIRLREAIG